MRNLKLQSNYRHFKGGMYKTLELAKDGETLEEYVVYQSLETNLVWIRKLSVFLSEVDKDKYPDVNQVYRFEEVNLFDKK